MTILESVKRKKLIAIIRGVRKKNMIQLADALYAGGISLMEVTFDQRSEEGIKETVDSIRLLSQERGSEITVGAGTVLTADQVKMAYKAGAQFIITPTANVDVITQTKRFGMLAMPGAYTPTEIELAYRSGADIVKVFPAGTSGIDYIKAVHAPLAHIPLAAVGGVSVENAGDFLRAGVCCVGIGSSLINRKRIEEGDFEWVTEQAAKLQKAVT